MNKKTRTPKGSSKRKSKRKIELRDMIGLRADLSDIDEACYSPDPLDQFLKRSAYYNSIKD
jgi:hypothetical protein